MMTVNEAFSVAIEEPKVSVAQTSVDSAARSLPGTVTEMLGEVTGLSSIHLIPAKQFGREETWKHEPDQFSLELGRAAASFVHRVLSQRIALGNVKTADVLRIGVAGGRTLFAAFDALQGLSRPDSFRIEVIPLVSLPIPPHYFAQSVAEHAARRLEPAIVPKVATWDFSSRPFQFQSEPLADPADLDVLVLGIGGKCSSNLQRHLHSVRSYGAESIQATAGDICSRLFDAEGQELDADISDGFVRLTRSNLANVAAVRGAHMTPVIVVAGGQDKVEALSAVLRVKPLLFNTLVTDEFTARALLKELCGSDAHAVEQLPVACGGEYDGKRIGDEFTALLRELRVPTPLRDANGRLLGVFQPATEVEQNFNETGLLTTRQIFENLRTLTKDPILLADLDRHIEDIARRD